MNRAERRANRRGRTTLQPDPHPSGTPKAWFDQFPGLEDPSKWALTEWCPRHWAPSPLLGYQGMRAQRMLMEHYMSEIKPPNLTSPRSINRHLSTLTTPVCCQLGDERMYLLWGQCAPNRPSN